WAFWAARGPSVLSTEDTLNRCGQVRVTLPESWLQHSGHRIRIEVFTMRKGAASMGFSND
ncbi:hypothetical protein, partial [Corynebacterium sp. HMSC30G07]|uniref:hypothetical protein n=1 Tax=Corynebacterium sp. HMSC30G07 TaxID=1581072 RepID=UPI001AEF4EA8